MKTNHSVDRDAAKRALTSGRTFLTLGGVETFLLFQQGFPLREFCSFEVHDDDEAFARLEREFLRPTLDLVRRYGYGFVCDCFLWRATPDYLKTLGYPAGEINRISRGAVVRMREMIDRWRADTGTSTVECPSVIKGEIGPRGDGYALRESAAVGAEQSVEYHRIQVGALRDAGVEVAFALTMTSVNESVAIVRAAKENELPIVISPTVETDGNLPGGVTLGDYVAQVDEATQGHPLYYMVNCAHPSHLEPVLREAKKIRAPWLGRFRGFRANASVKSHEELDNSPTLDAGDAADLAARMADLQREYDLKLIGGCCGTDAGHIDAIAAACSSSDS